MSEPNRMTANIILHSARALAGYAAGDLLESHPEFRESAGPAAFQRWQNLLAQCLEELSAAIATSRPQLFIEHVRWLQSLLAARGERPLALESGLDCLAKVLAAELPEATAGLAAGVCREAGEALKQETVDYAPILNPESAFGRLAASYLLALLEGDRTRAMQIVTDAAEAGHTVQDLYMQVLLPAQEEAGRMWQAAEINVAEEHFATATTRMVMAQLRGRALAKDPNGKTLVASAVAGNQHDIGLQAVADFFEIDGWRVIQLGSDMPVHDLVQAVAFYHADLLGLSVCLHGQLTTLKQTIDAVRNSQGGAAVKILVGGRGLTGVGELAAEFGADGYASDPIEAVALGNALVGLTSDPPDGGVGAS